MIPPRFTLNSLIEFILKPYWGINYITSPKFELPHLQDYVGAGTSAMTSIGDYLQYAWSINELEGCWGSWKKWGGHFALKGVVSVEDAKRAIDIGCTGVIVSNHGGRQLDGSVSPFDQLARIVDAVGDKIDVICEGGFKEEHMFLKHFLLEQKLVQVEGFIYML